MRSRRGMTLVNFIIIVVLIGLGIYLISNGFGHSTEEIAEETQRIITENWAKEGVYVTIVEDMTLVKKGKNEYSGMMKIMYEGKTINLTGTVIYDGKNIQWQPDTQNLLYQMLY